MLGYEIVICWSNEDRAFIAEAGELPGCMAHGDDRDTALGNIKDAMQLWIDTAAGVRQSDPAARGRAPDACVSATPGSGRAMPATVDTEISRTAQP